MAAQPNEEATFPRLTQPQLARVAAHGRARAITPGELLVRAGDATPPFFVVLAGQVEVTQLGPGGETPVVVLGPGQFNGEANMLSGQRSLVQARVIEGGEVIELSREHLLELVQRDAEIGEILVRAFVLRRVRLIASGLGDVVLIGSNYCAGTLRVKEFLGRNGHPYSFVDLDRDSDVQVAARPVSHQPRRRPGADLSRRATCCAVRPMQRIAECLGLNDSIAVDHTHDVIVVGAGPAGLSAAVYAASEGLDVLVIEGRAPGGQAGSSSRIENYLGFPTGISGQALAGRALTQAQKFGAQLLIARTAASARLQRPAVCRSPGRGRQHGSHARNRHRNRRGILQASRLRRCRGSRASASITRPRSWRRSCARVKK